MSDDKLLDYCELDCCELDYCELDRSELNCDELHCDELHCDELDSKLYKELNWDSYSEYKDTESSTRFCFLFWSLISLVEARRSFNSDLSFLYYFLMQNNFSCLQETLIVALIMMKMFVTKWMHTIEIVK